MKSQELTPNVTPYQSVISACANGVQTVAAPQLFETMKSQELTPKVLAYKSGFSACAASVQASAAYNSSRRLGRRSSHPM